MSWTKIKFGELFAEPTRNGIYKSAESHGYGCKIVNMGEIFAYDFIGNQEMQRIDMSQQELEKAGLKVNDLLFARRSLVESGAGKASIVTTIQEKLTFESSIIRVRLDESKCYPLFYLYWLKSYAGRTEITALVTGTNVKGIRGSALKDIIVDYPEYTMQVKIATLLKNYDDLIENNQKQIKLLEEAAQRLYKEWFVDLRFPGHKDVDIVDGVPNGWKHFFLSEIVEYEIGGGWGEETITEKFDQPAYVIRGTDLYGITHGNISNIPFRYHAASNLKSRNLIDGDIIFEVSGGSKTEGVARSILIRDKVLEFFEAPVMCASFCKLVRMKEKQYVQLLFDTFQYMRYSGKTGEYDKKSASSIVNYRWKDFLLQEMVLIPDEELLKKYNDLSENIYKMILTKSIEIEKAKEARDRLLPKLMSGEIEV